MTKYIMTTIALACGYGIVISFLVFIVCLAMEKV